MAKVCLCVMIHMPMVYDIHLPYVFLCILTHTSLFWSEAIKPEMTHKKYVLKWEQKNNNIDKSERLFKVGINKKTLRNVEADPCPAQRVERKLP